MKLPIIIRLPSMGWRPPAPSTFAEGQRAIALWLMSAAGMAFGLGIAGLVLLVTWGPWSADSEHLRLLIVAGIAGSLSIGMICVVLALAVGGPVGRFKMDASRDGFSAALEDRPDPPTPIATVTTTTEVKP